MWLKKIKVAVIGAGPVGLAMAKLLQQAGTEVVVYEWDKDPLARVWGGTLDLYPETGQKALDKAGILDRYFDLAIPMGRILADEQGNIVATAEPGQSAPEINRNNLRKILLDSLANGTVVWDRKFTGLEEYDGKWRLQFEGQQDEFADMVIGANGGMSKVRKYATAVTAEDSGSFIIQAEVYEPEVNCPHFHALCKDKIFMTSGERMSLVANPKNNGALTYAVMFNRPDSVLTGNELDFHDADKVCEYLSQVFAGWADSYRELFRATSFFVGLKTKKNPLDKPWEMHRPLPLTLIGDAAHLMPPFAGQGVNTGLLDALILSENLVSGTFDSIEAAISDYEQKMFGYAGVAQRETSQNEEAMRAPGFSFRNRLAPDK